MLQFTAALCLVSAVAQESDGSMQSRPMVPHGLWFGSLLLGPGDLNQDGVPDIIVGDRGDDGRSAVLWAISGRLDAVLFSSRHSGKKGSPLLRTLRITDVEALLSAESGEELEQNGD